MENNQNMVSFEQHVALLTERTMDEFRALNKVPRPTYYNEKVIEYLMAFATRYGLECARDDYGNVWFDIPARPGCEHLPKIILQGHSDMVCVAVPDLQVDFKTAAIESEVDGNIMTAKGTTLGADDGIGVAMSLALATCDVPHGPVRVLVTSDEEGDLDGARELDPKALNADYLINIDSEDVDEICCSSAGYLDYTVEHAYANGEIHSDEKVYRLSISGLQGGHSGDDINKNRLHAGVALRTILTAWRAAGLAARLVKIESGVAINVITQSGYIDVALPASVDAEVEKVRQAALVALQAQFPQEYIVCTLDESQGECGLSLDDSDDLLAMWTALPQGVIAMSEKMEGLVRSSANVGIMRLQEGKARFSVSCRSCVSADLDKLASSCSEGAERHGYTYISDGQGPGWDGDPQAPLVRLMQEAYREATQTEAKIVATHGALECGWFTPKRPTMQIVSIGPTLRDVHTTGEKLYLDTVKPTVARLLYCLAHIA